MQRSQWILWSLENIHTDLNIFSNSTARKFYNPVWHWLTGSSKIKCLMTRQINSSKLLQTTQLSLIKYSNLSHSLCWKIIVKALNKIKCVPVIKQSDGQYVINNPLGDGDKSGDYSLGATTLVYTRGDGVNTGDSLSVPGSLEVSIDLAVSFVKYFLVWPSLKYLREKFWQKFFVSCWSPISTMEWSTNTWLRHLLAPDTMVGGGLGPVVTTSGVCRWWVCAADHVAEECRDWCPGVWGGEEAGLLLSTGVMLTWGQETGQWPATDHPVPQPGSRDNGLTAVSAVVTGHRRGEHHADRSWLEEWPYQCHLICVQTPVTVEWWPRDSVRWESVLTWDMMWWQHNLRAQLIMTGWLSPGVHVQCPVAREWWRDRWDNPRMVMIRIIVSGALCWRGERRIVTRLCVSTPLQTWVRAVLWHGTLHQRHLAHWPVGHGE